MSAEPLSRVATLVRLPGRIDIVVAGADGSMYWNWHDDSTWWEDWSNIGQGVPGAAVTAVSRSPENADLFLAGRDNMPLSSTWDVGSWGAWLGLPTTPTTPGSPITAVARTLDQQYLDVFMAGSDKQIVTASWNATDGWQKWLPVGDGTARPATWIGAVSGTPERIDLIATGADGTIDSTWWDKSDGWQDWAPLATNLADAGAPVEAIALGPDRIDAFVTAKSGEIYSSFWTP
jgi:hypothetical protein